MTKGIDSNTVLTGYAASLVAAGIQFAGRYYKSIANGLSRSEAEVLSKSGIWIVSICEIGYPTQPGYFSQAMGQANGHHSVGMAIDAGQPEGTAIYYTVDYDAPPEDLPRIEAYFRGVAEARHGYVVGVYGSGLVCSHIRQLGLAEKSWLAAPLGWRGSQYSGWDIRQTTNDTILCGVRVDLDESKGDAGGWKIDLS